MKRLLLALAATLAVASAATAADMPVKARTYAPPEVIANDWRGFYVGLNGGYNLGSFSPVFGGDTTVNLDDNSPFVGGHIGFLAQTGQFVIGPEFGIQYWGSKGQANVEGTTFQQSVDWVAYANVRAGITFGSTLVYATGGAAWAHSKGTLIELSNLSVVETTMGWNIGAGVEFKITPNMSIGGEYRHYDFGAPLVTSLLGSTEKLTTDQLMGRLNFRFN